MPNHVELLDILLANRGIAMEDREKFLNPKYEDHLYDPFLMAGMERACVRVFEAIEAKEKIVIYSDYDCDGIPSAVMMNDFFHKINYENFSIYIPDRHDEGYGLHMDAIREFIKDDVGLIITFDLGITAIDEVAFAQASGVDVIITDHHLPKLSGIGSEELSLPRAYAILNPKVSDEKNGKVYPDTMLCGAGVCFKLVQALISKYGEYWKISKGWEKWLLDMAGIATLSDQVPLVDENRVLAFYGLKVLRTGVRPGIVEIFNKNSVDFRKLNEDDIAFTLVPKINAASRMDNPMNAFLLLASKDMVESKELAEHLMKINDERKYLVAQIMKEVKHALSEREEKTVIVIGNPKWRIGVLGIVASKIVDEYKRPVFVWGSDGSDTLRGSCRSFGGINLVETMSLLPADSLLEFGGHAFAGGFSVSHEMIHLLEDSIVEVFIKHNLTALLKEENMAD